MSSEEVDDGEEEVEGEVYENVEEDGGGGEGEEGISMVGVWESSFWGIVSWII